MKTKNFFGLVIAGLMLSITIPAMAGPSHDAMIRSYKGTATCLKCHKKAAKQFVHTIHYLWMGSTPDVVNLGHKHLGKRSTFNCFGTYTMTNWIGIVKNKQGKVIAQGCSMCHAGLGKKPKESTKRAELENIDCLICHAKGYKRQVVKEHGRFVWKPVGTPKQVTAMAKSVGMPTRGNCLACHAYAGGGPNLKRGDLEPGHVNPSPELDVHMSPKGHDMQCIDCHKGKAHAIAGGGRGDIDTNDTGKRLTCQGCHTEKPHHNAILDRHTKTVACETCHIPAYAKQTPTDVYRNWCKAVYFKPMAHYVPAIKFGKNVTPQYGWSNGKMWHQALDKPLKIAKDGTFPVMIPKGDIQDPKARIYPFKKHPGVVPYDPQTKRFIPVAVGYVFKTGDARGGIIRGAQAFLHKKITDYKCATGIEWMPIFHEVAPKDQALKCKDCHAASGGRLDWKALGYPGDPQKTGSRFKLFHIKK